MRARIRGLAMLQVQPNWIGVVQDEGKRYVAFASAGEETRGPALTSAGVQLRMHVEDETVSYAYSLDGGKRFVPFGTPSKMRFSWWKGARPSLFSYTSDAQSAERGHADFGWVRIRQIAPERS